MIKNSTTGALAAILIEPIQGTAGNVVPPPEFMPAVQEIAKEQGALLISDEMICGFGRTGTWFGCEQWGVVPDVVTMGKGLGGGFPSRAWPPRPRSRRRGRGARLPDPAPPTAATPWPAPPSWPR